MDRCEHFPPTEGEVHARIACVRPADYAQSRNALDGAVTGLSPYITHGFVDLAAVAAGVAARHPLPPGHRLMFELGWRAFFRHAWRQHGDGIFRSIGHGPLPDGAYAPVLPDDVREARTGVPVIDTAVRTLYATGYLHNHARMWLASYVVHVRRVHWRAGADWLVAHLLDGDLASNHLSWQWVAGTFSKKPYLFNADNVARFAPPCWHSPGSVIDTSYEALAEMASGDLLPPVRPAGRGVVEPPVRRGPGAALPVTHVAADAVAGRDVWLVHPWALGAPPADLPTDHLCVAVIDRAFHDRWGWSDARWAFVTARLQALASVCWHDSADAVVAALRSARSVRTVDNPHLDAALRAAVSLDPADTLFPQIDRPCASFSQWWKHAGAHAGTPYPNPFSNLP